MAASWLLPLLALAALCLHSAEAAYSASGSGHLRKAARRNTTNTAEAAAAALASVDHAMLPPELKAHDHVACLAADHDHDHDLHGEHDQHDVHEHDDADKDGAGKCFRTPKVWGPPTWFFLHAMTFALPEKVPQEKRIAIENLLNSLPLLLPCPACGQNLAKKMKENPVKDHLFTRDEMVQWMVDIHNSVNRDTGKRQYTKEEVIREYDAAYDKKNGEGYMAVLAPEGKEEEKQESHDAVKETTSKSNEDGEKSERGGAAQASALFAVALAPLACLAMGPAA
eukprot:TRINITY_DN101515_c0_g1_i1.p1 TRINITY_DN101515_c0_g1~~TRINITY_DN101515_c0_g1_i1.p1  ORF type:complete len:282 (+),score=77.32 TRINITY_DN101515_c0_g1_i1:99-944(+)